MSSIVELDKFQHAGEGEEKSRLGLSRAASREISASQSGQVDSASGEMSREVSDGLPHSDALDMSLFIDPPRLSNRRRLMFARLMMSCAIGELLRAKFWCLAPSIQ